MTTPSTAARCPGAARLRSRWTARALAGAFLDLFFAWAFLCFAALASAAARVLPCTCVRPHVPCLHAFLARYPARALRHIHASLRSRFPFDGEDSPRQREEPAATAVGGDGARAELQRELEKERSASASAAEEAMAMILHLQKEKSALEIEARQQRRTADERCAFYEDELEELRDIVLHRERELRSLRREVDGYRRLLGLAPEDEEDEVMMTPRSFMPDSQPSSSRSVGVQLGNHSGFSFQTPSFRQEMVRDDLVKVGIDDDCIAVQTPTDEAPGVESKQELDTCHDDGAETVEILPLSARSLDFNQIGDFHVDAGAGMEEQTTDKFQQVACRGMDTISHDHSGSENDSNIYDVHVVDDICFSKEGVYVFLKKIVWVPRSIEIKSNQQPSLLFPSKLG
jgi:hypothetical protein